MCVFSEFVLGHLPLRVQQPLLQMALGQMYLFCDMKVYNKTEVRISAEDFIKYTCMCETKSPDEIAQRLVSNDGEEL